MRTASHIASSGGLLAAYGFQAPCARLWTKLPDAAATEPPHPGDLDKDIRLNRE